MLPVRSCGLHSKFIILFICGFLSVASVVFAVLPCPVDGTDPTMIDRVNYGANWTLRINDGILKFTKPASGCISRQYHASGGTPPYSWSISGTGVTIDSQTGMVGICDTAGCFFTVTVTDDNGNTDSVQGRVGRWARVGTEHWCSASGEVCYPRNPPLPNEEVIVGDIKYIKVFDWHIVRRGQPDVTNRPANPGDPAGVFCTVMPDDCNNTLSQPCAAACDRAFNIVYQVLEERWVCN